MLVLCVWVLIHLSVFVNVIKRCYDICESRIDDIYFDVSTRVHKGKFPNSITILKFTK